MGLTKNCHLYRENASWQPPYGNINHFKHGMRNSRIYNIWRAMRQRCNNSRASNYKNYGGRGIEVCCEWNNSFISFYDWAMQNGYEDTKTIDRINVNGDYTPCNCRWATYREQNNNRRNNRSVKLDGEEHTLGQWSQITGVSLPTIWARLDRGWTVREALTNNRHLTTKE